MQDFLNTFDPGWYKTEEGMHRGKEIIWIKFPHDKTLVKMLRMHSRPLWSSTQKCWYLPDTRKNRELFGMEPKIVGKEVLTKISETNLEEFRKFQNILTLKGFSINTIRSYSIEFAQLLYLLKDYPVQNLKPERLQSYFLYCVKELGISENQIHSRMNAVKFYFEKVLHKDRMFFDIPRPKRPLQLPKYLTTSEIRKILDAVENPKHLLMLKLCYGMGLRVSEIIRLRVEDIDSSMMRVLIQSGKGKKDRYVNLPDSILQELRNYYRSYLPEEFLFEGRNKEQYRVRTVQMVFKNAMKKAGIKKSIGIHGLRHSYATHLLEYGTDISLIQKLLGHDSIKTTLTYTQVADKTVKNVKSPLDRI